MSAELRAGLNKDEVFPMLRSITVETKPVNLKWSKEIVKIFDKGRLLRSAPRNYFCEFYVKNNAEANKAITKITDLLGILPGELEGIDLNSTVEKCKVVLMIDPETLPSSVKEQIIELTEGRKISVPLNIKILTAKERTKIDQEGKAAYIVEALKEEKAREARERSGMFPIPENISQSDIVTAAMAIACPIL